MKKYITFAALPVLVCLLSYLPNTAVADAIGADLPEPLGQWYKPHNRRQVWLHTMFAMRRELQAVREYAQRKDADHMAKWAQRLAEHYHKLPQMVPEWRGETDTDLIRRLLKQVEAGDYAGTLGAADRLQRDCRSCHRQYQALAALKYRWPRFDSLRIRDGNDGNQVYADHMQALSNALNRIKIASEDDRWDAAEESLSELRTLLAGLGEGCRSCHKQAATRERILGAESSTTLDELEQALSAKDPRSAARRLGAAAVQICARCHGVHRLLSDTQRHLFD